MLFASGQLPKFENQQYKLNDPDYPFYMIPTAEIPLNGLHIDEILEEEPEAELYGWRGMTMG